MFSFSFVYCSTLALGAQGVGGYSLLLVLPIVVLLPWVFFLVLLSLSSPLGWSSLLSFLRVVFFGGPLFFGGSAFLFACCRLVCSGGGRGWCWLFLGGGVLFLGACLRVVFFLLFAFLAPGEGLFHGWGFLGRGWVRSVP